MISETADKELIEKLIDTAIGQMSMAYTPYSHFDVGAALSDQRPEDLYRMQH